MHNYFLPFLLYKITKICVFKFNLFVCFIRCPKTDSGWRTRDETVLTCVVLKALWWGYCFSTQDVISVGMDLQGRLFVYVSFIPTGESVTATQWLFCLKLNVGQHGVVPSRDTIRRVKHFSNILDKKQTCLRHSVTTPESVARVREVVFRSLGRSAKHQASELRISLE